MKYKTTLFVLAIISLLSISQVSKAVYFASDNVYLYQLEKKVSSNAIYLASYKSWSARCDKGLCQIGQQFYPVIVYLPKSEDLLTEPEFSSHYIPIQDPNMAQKLERLKTNGTHKILKTI